MSRAAADKRGVAIAASNLAHALARQGKSREAIPLQREALLIVQELGDVQAIAEIVLDIAALAISQREYAKAGTFLGAVGALADSAEFALVPVEVEWFDGMIDEARRELGSHELDRATASGGQMAPDDVVACAVEFIDSTG
jgi:hypothetical protein